MDPVGVILAGWKLRLLSTETITGRRRLVLAILLVWAKFVLPAGFFWGTVELFPPQNWFYRVPYV